MRQTQRSKWKESFPTVQAQVINLVCGSEDIESHTSQLLCSREVLVPKKKGRLGPSYWVCRGSGVEAAMALVG